MKKVVLLSLVILFFVSMVWAQEKVEAPVWNVGDRWNFKRMDGVTFWQEVADVKEGLFIVKMTGEKDLYGYDKKTLNLKFLIEESGRQVRSKSARKMILDFPIFVGKKWTDTISSIPAGGRVEVTFINEFRIEGTEEVTTPAGKFQTYRIFYKQTNMANQQNGWVRYWYSPEAKMWVKREPENTDMWYRIPAVQFAELVSYKFK